MVCGDICFQEEASDIAVLFNSPKGLASMLRGWIYDTGHVATVYPKKYAHGFCFAVLCCGYTLTDFPISIRLTSLALWQSNDCPSASKATLMNMDKYFMWIHYERLHNHNKAKHNKTMCIFLGIYCRMAVGKWGYGIVQGYWQSPTSLRTPLISAPFFLLFRSWDGIGFTKSHHLHKHWGPF